MGLRRLALAGFSLSAVACSPLYNAHVGIRPDPPVFAPEKSPCEQFKEMVDYGQTLQEAYHSRATQNRFWIYAAGTVALGTVAATGGLGAAGAAGLSIALLSVSGGFTSGFFAIIDNSTLADVYTISANRIAEALTESRKQLAYGPAGPEGCKPALDLLAAKVTAAQTDLERARTDAAVAAVIRARAQMDKLSQLISTTTTTTTTTPTTTSRPHQ
jgi:hypothetical protein